MDSLVFSNIAHRPARTAVSILGTGVGVLLIVFTVGLAHGVLKERGRRESNIGAEIMIRASGSLGLGGQGQFKLPADACRGTGHCARSARDYADWPNNPTRAIPDLGHRLIRWN